MINLLKNNIQFFTGILFIFYLLFTISNSMEINDNVLYSTLLTFIIYILTVGEFLYFYKKYGKPRLQDWMKLAIFFMLILNYMKTINNQNGLSSIPFVIGRLSLDNSIFTMLVIITALISLDFVYILGKKVKKESFPNEYFYINRKNMLFYLLILTTLFQSYLLFSGVTGFGSNNDGISGSASFIKMLSSYLSPFALIISAYVIFIENNTNKKFNIIFYSSLSTQILTGFLSGMKENSLEPILYTLIVFLIAGKKIPRKFIFIGIFIFAFLYPINNAYRDVITNPYLNTRSSVNNMVIAIKSISTKPFSEVFLGGVESYGDRSSMFPFLLYGVNTEHQWTYYKYMTRYLTLPINWLIPRTVWANKPSADIGAVLYKQITGVRTATAVTVTTIGWAYLEGGILFVFITFIILGLILEFIDRKNYKNPMILLFYATLFHLVIKPEWDSYFAISSLIPMFIIYWFLLKILDIKRIPIEN